jgi:hypothetical protein
VPVPHRGGSNASRAVCGVGDGGVEISQIGAFFIIRDDIVMQVEKIPHPKRTIRAKDCSGG